ncbi:hypothetical protein P9112_000307 [Eukaryota sp. TZLM1-RC]
MKYHLYTTISTPHRECKCVCTTPSGSIWVGGDYSSPTIIEYTFDPSLGMWKQSRTLSDGHTNFITKIIHFSATSDYPERLFTSGGDGNIIQWDLNTCSPSMFYTGHTSAVSSISIHNNTLFSSSWDHTICKFDIITGKCQAVLKDHQLPINDVLALSDDLVLSASSDKTVKLWSNNTVLATAGGHPDIVKRVVPSTEPGVFVSICNDGAVRFWSLEKMVCLKSLFCHSHFVYGLALGKLGDSEVAVSGGEDQQLIVTINRTPVQNLAVPQVVWALDFLYNGDVVAGFADGFVRVFSFDQGRKASEEDIVAYNQLVEESLNRRALHSSGIN